MATRRQVLGTERSEVAAVLSNLAGLFKAKSEYDEAETLYHEALAIRRRMFGNDLFILFFKDIDRVCL